MLFNGVHRKCFSWKKFGLTVSVCQHLLFNGEKHEQAETVCSNGKERENIIKERKARKPDKCSSNTGNTDGSICENWWHHFACSHWQTEVWQWSLSARESGPFYVYFSIFPTVGFLTALRVQARETALSPPRLHLKHKWHHFRGQDKSFSQKPWNSGTLKLMEHLL